MKYIASTLIFVSSLFAVVNIPATSQKECYDNNYKIVCPKKGNAFYGQDAQFFDKYSKLSRQW
jgi:hypothetical protein